MTDNNNYSPQPIDTSKVKLPEELDSLVEIIAKNVHEVWALNRITEGWSYGSLRNDELKQHPCLVEYELIPDSEKEYNRNAAIATYNAICNGGFKIYKK